MTAKLSYWTIGFCWFGSLPIGIAAIAFYTFEVYTAILAFSFVCAHLHCIQLSLSSSCCQSLVCCCCNFYFAFRVHNFMTMLRATISACRDVALLKQFFACLHDIGTHIHIHIIDIFFGISCRFRALRDFRQKHMQQ